MEFAQKSALLIILK